jgi:hypothetical protein
MPTPMDTDEPNKVGSSGQGNTEARDRSANPTNAIYPNLVDQSNLMDGSTEYTPPNDKE